MPEQARIDKPGACLVAKTINPDIEVIDVQVAAAPPAAALQSKERVQGKSIALVLSGGNIAPDNLKLCLD